MELQTNVVLILLTALIVGGIFWVVSAVEKRRLLALQRACDLHGWRCGTFRERLKKAFVVTADRWRLETGTQTSERSSQGGSADAVGYTEWRSEPVGRCSDLRLRFGTPPGGSAGLSEQPDRGFFFASALGPSGIASALRLQPLHGGRFLLMLESERDAAFWRQTLSDALAEWPVDWPLIGRLEEGVLSLSIVGKRIDKPEDLLPVIRLGEALIRQMDATEETQAT